MSVARRLLVTFLIPVTAIFLSVFVLDEGIETKHFAGMVLIAFGLAAINGRLFVKFHTATPDRVIPRGVHDISTARSSKNASIVTLSRSRQTMRTLIAGDVCSIAAVD